VAHDRRIGSGNSRLATGWPDWAIFRPRGDCLLPTDIKITKIASNFGLLFPEYRLCIYFDKRRLGLHFGLFFHKLIWSHWLAILRANPGLKLTSTKSEILWYTLAHMHQKVFAYIPTYIVSAYHSVVDHTSFTIWHKSMIMCICTFDSYRWLCNNGINSYLINHVFFDGWVIMSSTLFWLHKASLADEPII
jgi:hypothetical protein